ncbi:peroxiredoxin [Teichococcus oryzae]|uniref:Peroxiredoxin n=1 Tax=Teichococcus oryzae TaxID=1608942 RepID=A0A5B2THB3_9PROT|nr:peroxiredoxin [Pseudoroseomonas oryzae]KAA2213170.1 peroxiredoxin [Pseudoroseomonas oryzae]
MSIQLGQIAPDFTAETTAGTIRFHDWAGSSWVVFFSHPKDFTPVCTTELGEAARLKPEFDKRGTKIIGLSVDSLDNHGAWNADIAETQGSAVNFPMIADSDRKVSELYGMIHPEADPSVTVRTVYVIDPQKKVRLTLTYPPATGRNFQEVLRVLDSLQLTDRHKVATPVNWQPGDRAIIVPSVSDEQARERFPQGWDAQKPYLRWVDVKGS